jgi:hypothetical protein
VEAGLGERKHYLSPAVGELGEAVKEQEERARIDPLRSIFEACFQDVHPEAVDVLDEAGADAGGQDGFGKWS